MTHSARKSAKKIQTATRKKPGPAVAALHLLSDAVMRRISEKIFKLSDADETEVEIGVVTDALTRFANNTRRFRATSKIRRTSRPPTAPAPSLASRKWRKSANRRRREFSRRA